MNKVFILKMIENISKSYSGIDTYKGFAEDLYALASNPDVDLTYLKNKLNELREAYEIPESTIATIKELNRGINNLIQKEIDNKTIENTAQLAKIEEAEIKRQEEIEAAIRQEEIKKEEVIQEQVEEIQEENENVDEVSISEETDNMEQVDSYNKIEEVTLTMGENDIVDDIARQLIELKAKGIAAHALINGMDVHNVFDSVDQFKEGYYNFQSQNLINLYNSVMTKRGLGEHTNMMVVTPEGADNKRMIYIGNSDSDAFDVNKTASLVFTDGRDFDMYIMPNLIEEFTKDCSEIKEVDDEKDVTRGMNFSNKITPDDSKERYRYFATMTNENKLMLTMASESIDQAKVYINQSTRVVTDEVKREANEQIAEANKNGEQLEKAAVKVKQLPHANGFVSGLGIGALVGLSIVGNIIGLYLLKLFR